jgi:hypothetical protein
MESCFLVIGYKFDREKQKYPAYLCVCLSLSCYFRGSLKFIIYIILMQKYVIILTMSATSKYFKVNSPNRAYFATGVYMQV